ncbi:galactose oxidase-like domain-containing protein [Streptomyces macrosporus]|uniref:Galactose oxidase n=1 Tax=Streptomyces macrosporus TaxID=44032 RepID=A0ABN3JKT0_9ACTN
MSARARPPIRTPARRHRRAGRLRRTTALPLLLSALLATGLSLSPAAADPAPAAENLLVDPGFETSDGDGFAQCWQRAGWGDNTFAYSLTTDAHTGDRAARLTVTDWASGDRKIMVEETAACAPEVEPGKQYDLAVHYTSTTDNTVFTAFRHDPRQGWLYWTDLKTLPATGTYTRAEVRTPQVPEGTDRIAWGVTVYGGGGTLTLDDAEMTAVAVDPPEEPQDPDASGSWEVRQMDAEARAMHFVQLHNGKVLMIAGSGNDPDRFAAGTFTSHLYDPATGEMTDVDTPEDLFCSGHVHLEDGRVLVMGGNLDYPAADGSHGYKGLKNSYVFDPATNEYTRVNDMNAGHWYPSATVLGNGDVLSLGGLDEKSEGTVTAEYFSADRQRWLGLHEVNQTWSFWGLYPSMILLQDGRLFYSGSHVFGNGLPGTGASLYDYGTGTITDVPGLRRKDERDQSMSVLLPPAQRQRVATFGGGNVDSNPAAHRLTDIVDLGVPDPAYVPGPDLPRGHYSDGTPQTGDEGKMYVSAVILPDGTVLETGGALHNRAEPVHEASIFDPTTDTFTPVAPDPEPRGYHSGSLLLPDGRVLSYGDNPGDGSYATTLSLYSPPYLSKGPRPDIAPPSSREWTYGTENRITVSGGGQITKAALVRPEAVTHSSDPNQRYVDLPMTVHGEAPGGGTEIGLNLTDNPNLAPPGWYMLFVTDANGVPSVAEWVRIEGEEQAARTLRTEPAADATSPKAGTGDAEASERHGRHGTSEHGKRPRRPARDVEAWVDGCDRSYGDPSQCLPSVFPAEVKGSAAKCRWLDGQGWKPFPVHGRDRHRLDTDRDGTACGRGDRGGAIG